ncbi:hypothetical protein [Vibrio sonorensis]|uniref:hypothetical protein n=1 Tax=Vibrio sonorensis TaxID=1004316 RepID=UPI000AB0DE9C|nr:hypothetical protein [Vibrio sonorensis]
MSMLRVSKSIIGTALGSLLLASAPVIADSTVGPNGELPTAHTEVNLSPAQADQVKAKNLTAAILMHSTSDWSNALITGAKDKFSQLNIEVVAVTDAEFNANKQKTDVETAMQCRRISLSLLWSTLYQGQQHLNPQ